MKKRVMGRSPSGTTLYLVTAKDIRPDGARLLQFTVGVATRAGAMRLVGKHAPRLLAARGAPVQGILVVLRAHRVKDATNDEVGVRLTTTKEEV